MKLVLQRFSDNRDSTLGILFKKAVHASEEVPIFMAYTIEDEHREQKVSKETRIPAGFYEIRYRQTETPLTLKYRTKYSWFKWHLEIMNVPNFTGIYIHVGNTDDDSAGCIIVGDVVDNNRIGGGSLGYSRQAFKRIYSEICSELDGGSKVFIEIRNEISLIKL